jgi:hypothetical protein
MFVIYLNCMATGIYIWHAPHSRRVVCEDAHKEGRHLSERADTGPMRMLLVYVINIY